jgi:hypothetical protein
LIEGIDGQEDMRLIFGIIVVEERDKLAKEDKVRSTIFFNFFSFG